MKVKWKTDRIAAVMGCLFFLLNFCIFVQGKESDSVEDMNCTVFLNGKEFDGTYSGKVENGTPEGKGTFQTDEKYEDGFLAEGKFKDGELSGKITFTFSDGHVETGKVKDKQYNGVFQIIEADGSCQEVRYDSGVRVGRTVFYDASDTVTRIDWYYDNSLLGDLIDDAEKFTAKAYYADPYWYAGLSVKADGTAEMVIQTEEKCIIKLADQDGALYLVTYPNGQYDKELPTIVPSVKAGDKITVYGMFQGISENEIPKDSDYGYSFPEISAFYAEINGSKRNVFEQPQEPYSYEEICSDPYAFAELEIEVAGTVENVAADYEEMYVNCKVVTEDQEIYFVRLDMEDLDEDDFPLRGETIEVNGTIDGNYLEKVSEDEVRLYPLILG